MKKRYATKKLIEKTQKITNSLYESSIEELAEFTKPREIGDIHQFASNLRNRRIWKTWNEEEDKQWEVLQERVDILYLEKMITLPSKTIEDILFLHERMKPRRAPRTVEALISELTRRSLLDDVSQSDTKSIYKDESCKKLIF